jgi:molybdenum cofactor cytidylyltransferase
MNLLQALQPKLPARIAIVGSGGKTTALFQIARHLPGVVWVTTTTHLGTDQLDEADQHLIISGVEEIDIPLMLSRKSTLVTGLFTQDDRVSAPEHVVIEEMVRIAGERSVSLVVEADGSRTRPLKAPAAHEPDIPGWAEMVIVVAGLSACSKPFTPQWVHRPEQFELLTGLHQGQSIEMDDIVNLLIHPQGGLKNIPAGAARIVLLNQADSENLRVSARRYVGKLLDGGFDRVVICALRQVADEMEVYS